MERNLSESIKKMNDLISYDRGKTIIEQQMLNEREQLINEIGLGRILKFVGIASVFNWVVKHLFGGSESKLKDTFGVDDEKGFFSVLKSDKSARDKVSDLYKDSRSFNDFNYDDLPDDGVYKRILRGIGAPITGNNMALMYAWRKAESGRARNNPFNTMHDGGLAVSKYNQQGVKNYGSTSDGIQATVATLENGYYNSVVKSLKDDESPYNTAKKIGDSPWGTTYRLISSVLDDIKEGRKFTSPIAK